MTVSASTENEQRADRPPEDRDARRIAIPLVAMAAIAGAAAGYLAAGEQAVLVLLFPSLLLPILLWQRPRVGIYLVFGAAVTIEQFVYTVGPRDGAVTARIPAFNGGSTGGVNLVELILLLTAVVVIMHAVERGYQLFPRSVLAASLAVVLGFVVFYLMVGLFRGGEVKMSLWEVRPYFYLAATFLLTSYLFRNPGSVYRLLWILILGSASKAIYGLVIFLSIRNVQPRPEAVLAHEESFVFGLYVFVTLCLWLFRIRGPLRVVATALLPLVILVDMINSRRTAWLILILGLIVIVLVSWARFPSQRKRIGAALITATIATTIYIPVFWDQSGSLAQPARAVRSIVSPDNRDQASNEYREIENYNLETFIKQSHSLGMGYGIRLPYFGLVDLTEGAQMLAFVPHNGVLYVWLRTGILGMVAFTLLLTQAMISAVRLSLDRRREVAMVGAITAAALIAFAAMGLTDLGFFWFRNTVIMGVLLGSVQGLALGPHLPVSRERGPSRATTGRSDEGPAWRVGSS